MEPIKICIEPNETGVLKEWHNEVFTDSFFKEDRYQIISMKDMDPVQNNFLFLYLVPEHTMEFLSTRNENFWSCVRSKNIKLLFYNEQFNIFMRDGDIFKTYDNLPNGKLDIRGYLYWQIVQFCQSQNINEHDLYFIHSANGFMQEIDQMKHTVIPWLGTTLDLVSKHINFNEALGWGQKTEAEVKNCITIPYMCLFAGRPARHRHDLIKKLWRENLTEHGKISLSPMPDDTEFGSIEFSTIDGGPNQHHKGKGPYNYNETGVFQDTFLCVAGETYTPNGYAYFTEKTVKPILYERPFISYGNTGTLEYLHRLGFKTFNEFWDESYDTHQDDDKKLESIVKIIKQICQMSQGELNYMYQRMKPILMHNKNVLKNRDWGHDLFQLLK